MKIEYKHKGNNSVVAIITFKSFDDIQNLYEVISMATDSYTHGFDYDNPLYYDDTCVKTAFANGMVIARVILDKPTMYLVEDDEFGSYDSITEAIDDLCKYYIKELSDKHYPEFTKIAKQFVNAYKKLSSNNGIENV